MTPLALESVTAAPATAELKPGQTELWQRYRAAGPGDASEEELVKAYLPLVKTVVGRLAMSLPKHLDGQDLYSAGLVGLLNAVRQYNPGLGTAFEPYARLRIRGAVLDELRRMDWVPRAVRAKVRRMQAVLNQLEQVHGRIPTDAEMAAALELSVGEYEEWLDEIRPASFVSLDVATTAELFENAADHEKLLEEADNDRPEDTVSRQELARLIRERIEQLPELQRKILALHYYEDLRLSEIAEALGYSPAHICQTHARAILAIRASVEQYEASAVKNTDSAA